MLLEKTKNTYKIIFLIDKNVTIDTHTIFLINVK